MKPARLPIQTCEHIVPASTWGPKPQENPMPSLCGSTSTAVYTWPDGTRKHVCALHDRAMQRESAA